MKFVIQFFASLRLTVVLLSLSMVLIFFGTLDQVEYGIWHTQKLYFRSFLAVWGYPMAWPAHDKLFWLHIPMPGGYLLGGLLLINLVAAHVTRFQLSVKKSGIVLVHFGLILLLVSELLTSIVAVESQMPVDEGSRSNYSENHRNNELVFIDRSDPEFDTIHAIPVSLLKPGKTVDVPDSPLRIRTVNYFENSQLGRGTGAVDPNSPATEGLGVGMGIVVTPARVSYAENALNTATAYVEVLGPDGSLGTWLVSNLLDERFPPQLVQLDGETWDLSLRFKRHYYPFEVELIDFSHDKYPGTEIPFNFSSEVVVHHADSSKTQKALIYMNHPLRYEGFTFYQASFANDDRTSVFQIVRNPGWLLPYVSVLLMGLGLAIQFGMHFFRFLRKRQVTA